MQTSQQYNQPQQQTEVPTSQPTPTTTPISDNSGASDTLNTTAQNLVSGVGNFFSQNPIGKGISSFFSGVNNLISPQKLVNQNAPDTFSLLGDAASLPQRGLLSLAGALASKPSNPAPNFFDFSQNPGTQASKYFLGNNSNFLTELGSSFLTDPLMFLSGPEDAAKVALSSGKEVGLSNEGINALKDLAQQTHGTSDLVGLEQTGDLAKLKQQIAGIGEASHPEYFNSGGVKFMGKTIIPGNTLDSIGSAITNNPVSKAIANNPIVNGAKNIVSELTNPAFTRYGMLSDKELEALKGINSAKYTAITKMQDLVSSVFKGLNPDELSQFRDVAKFGLPVDDARMSRPDLIGKSVEEIKKLAPNLSDNVVKAYHSYINDALPKLEQIAKDEFGLVDSHTAANYLHEYKPSRMNLRDIWGSMSRPVKEMGKSGSTRQALESQQVIADAISKGEDPEAALKAAGFETNPALTTGRLAQERFLAQEVNNQIDNVIKNFGTKINPKDIPQEWLDANNITKPTLKDAIRYYKEQGHGIFQPQGNLRFYKGVEGNEIKVSNKVPSYAVSSPLASRLNEMRTGNAFQRSLLTQAAIQGSQGLLRFQFAFPQFAALHGIWHLAFNAFLESGGKYGLGAIGDTLNDIKDESPFYKMLKEKGALPHHIQEASGKVEDLIRQAAGQNEVKKGFLESLWGSKFNPLGKNYGVNTALTKEDDFLRDLTIRNNIQNKGMSLSEAIKRSNKFMVDYNNLTTQEKAWVRLVMPFYAWTKGNISAQIAGALEHPWRQLLPAKVQDVLNQEFTGHNMATNDSGHQGDIALGSDQNGKNTYLRTPFGSRDVGSLVNNPLSFLTNRMGQLMHMGSIATTGTDFGYPVSNPNSPTPEWLQRGVGMFNKVAPQDLTNLTGNFPSAEAKLGVILDPAQYTNPQPKTLLQRLGELTGLQTSAVTPDSSKNSFSQYEQRKIMRSLRKKSIF